MSALQNLLRPLDSWMQHVARLADNPTINWESIVLYSSLAQTAFELWLSYVLFSSSASGPLMSRFRQLACYARPAPPPEIASHIDSKTFKKAQSYGRDKCRFSIAKTVWSQAVSVAMLKGRVYARAWDAAGSIMRSVGLSPTRIVSPEHTPYGVLTTRSRSHSCGSPSSPLDRRS